MFCRDGSELFEVEDRTRSCSKNGGPSDRLIYVPSRRTTGHPDEHSPHRIFRKNDRVPQLIARPSVDRFTHQVISGMAVRSQVGRFPIPTRTPQCVSTYRQNPISPSLSLLEAEPSGSVRYLSTRGSHPVYPDRITAKSSRSVHAPCASWYV